MQQLVAEFSARAATAPDAIAVIDASGSHTDGRGHARGGAALARPGRGRRAGADRARAGRQHLAHPVGGPRRRHAGWPDRCCQPARDRPASSRSRAATSSRTSSSPRSRSSSAGTSPWTTSPDVPRRSTAGPWPRAPAPTSGVDRWRGGVVVAMTSGSTGRPKCVVQSEEALRYAGTCTIDAVGLQPGDPVGALVPLSSVAAFCFGMYLPAMLGSPMVTLDGWEPRAALQLMAEHDVRWTMLVPTMALQLSIRPRLGRQPLVADRHDGRWRPDGLRSAGPRRTDARHQVPPRLRDVGVPRPHDARCRPRTQTYAWAATAGRSPAPRCASSTRPGVASRPGEVGAAAGRGPVVSSSGMPATARPSRRR